MRFTSNRDLTLLHGLEQSALNFGGGAVDLVGQDKIGENRTFFDGELLGLLVVHQGAHNVCGKEVGRELNPAEVAGNGVA